MFSRLRTTLRGRRKGTVESPDLPCHNHNHIDMSNLPDKFDYSRPRFLRMDAEIPSSDHSLRPIITPADPRVLTWQTGYAECVNAGKSRYNEDQTAISQFHVLCSQRKTSSSQVTNNNRRKSPNSQYADLIVTYVGLFDGHAGTGAALMATHLLESHLQEKLSEVKEDLLDLGEGELITSINPSVTCESLVIGAIESALCALDEQMGRERTTYSIRGGCTALVALFILNTLYVANSGDCRAVLYINDEIIPMSRELSPAVEMYRIQTMAQSNPSLLRDEFSNRIFYRRVSKDDIGRKVLCREPLSQGWTYHEVTPEDIRPPLIRGEGKKSRLMDTIGVARCLGDHDLIVYGTDIHIKPFLIPNPEVQTHKLNKKSLTEEDFLIMGSDGLWDTLSNEDALQIVKQCFKQHKPDDHMRYTLAAKALVHHSRGTLSERGWRLDNDDDASYDDITAIVVPLHHLSKKVGTRL